MCGGNAERDPLCQFQCVGSHSGVGLFPKNVIYVNLLDTQGLPAMTSHSNCVFFTQGPLRVTTLYLSWWRQLSTLQRQITSQRIQEQSISRGPSHCVYTGCPWSMHKTQFWEGHLWCTCLVTLGKLSEVWSAVVGSIRKGKGEPGSGSTHL